MSEIGIGTTLWWISSRNRRQGWRSYVITGETRQSWLLGDRWSERKISKKTLRENNGQWGHEQFYTAEQRDNEVWVETNKYRIAGAVQACRDAAKLKQIAQILEVDCAGS